MIKYVAKYYYISHGPAIGGFMWGGGAPPFRSEEYGGGDERGDGNGFGWGYGNGWGNGDAVYYMFDLFNCRSFNFWEIEIINK